MYMYQPPIQQSGWSDFTTMVLIMYAVHVLFRFMLELKKEHKSEYIKKVTTMASDIGYNVNSLHVAPILIMYLPACLF